MRTDKEVLRKVKAIRKLIENLMGRHIEWRAIYGNYSYWDTLVELTLADVKLMEQSLLLIGTNIGMGWFCREGDWVVSLRIIAQKNSVEVTFTPLYCSYQVIKF